jgi:hypothetical protein
MGKVRSPSPVPGATGRGTSPAFKAYLARARAQRAKLRRAREAKGADWRDGNDFTGQSDSARHSEASELREREARQRSGLAEIDFNDRSYVDWSLCDEEGA